MIGYLSHEMRLMGENKELVDEIVSLSKKHGIMTPYTSFLVMEKEQDRAPGSPPAQTWIQTSLQADALYSTGRSEGKAMHYSMRDASGANAVRGAREVLKMKQQENAPAPSQSTIRAVGPKTFYQDGEAWVDAEYQAGGKVKEIKYQGDEYFALVKQHPGLGRYLAVGRQVTVVWEGESYRVVE